MKLILVLISICFYSACCYAEEGAVPIRISDGAKSRCIDSTKDKIWLTLRRVITTKKEKWFTEDKSVSAIINASLKSEPESPKPLSFPLMTEANIKDYSNGQISVPLEYTLINGFNLKQKDAMYTSIGVELTLLNKKGKNKWGKSLEALNEVAKKLPIPASPYTQAATYLIDFANSAVSKDMKEQNDDDKLKTASLAMNFDPSGKCEGGMDGSDFESTGTIAILQSEGEKGEQYIDVGKVNKYCWDAELRPAFVLKAAKKEGQTPCTDASYKPKYIEVSNNYMAFFLNAISGTGVLGPGGAHDKEDSLRRCKANGIEESECLK